MTESSTESKTTDQELMRWQAFVDAHTVEEFCAGWLNLQCHALVGVRRGRVFFGQVQDNPSPAAAWPPDDQDAADHLMDAARTGYRERRGRITDYPVQRTSAPDTPTQGHIVTYPLEVSGSVQAVVVMEIAPRPRPALQIVLRHLHWGAAWLELLVLRNHGTTVPESGGAERLKTVLTLVAIALEPPRFQAAATAVSTELAQLFHCDRVSIGFEHKGTIRVLALSHTAQFQKKSNLIRAIGAAMDEALDQQSVLVYPLAGDDAENPLVEMTMRQHEKLARHDGSYAILTVPLLETERVIGAMTLERTNREAFDPETVELMGQVALFVGPVLEIKRKNDRLLAWKIWDSLRAMLGALFGPHHPGLKLTFALILGLGIFFTFAEGDHRVAAPATLEGSVQNAIVAPLAGYVRTAPARAGDIVRAGDVLCTLDDRDLRLEHLKWTSQKAQHTRQYRNAMAARERAEIRILEAQIEQANAQISLLDKQLARTRLSAPFDGIIVSGDLSQSLGAPVERGQILFELAPLDAYRVILRVEDGEIAYIREEQPGYLALASLPGKAFPFTIETITPVAETEEGTNYFRVEAKLEGRQSPALRPGMTGIGKIDAGRRNLFWIWTHELSDWLRLKVWSWWP